MLKLILGLGNPGSRYEMTRHNAGFVVVSKLATVNGASFSFKSNMNADLCKTTISNNSVLLAKPQTYMNLSGQAAQNIAHFYKIVPQDILVVHDDVSLPLGTMRFAKGGGAGGQHGVESIMEVMGNRDFHRLKIGVGPDPGGARRADYVLADIPDIDQELYFTVITKASEAITLWLRRGIQESMNAYNGLDLRPKPAAKEEPTPLRLNKSAETD
jgi:peptidyl-tRNA hydrolase, PTH1 family